ncbi:hypothetical protein B1992_14390 [Pseudoxanthomonas broegbernensis]|uniref:Uncharacterized protein n=1 Tax=Pseudoxanthomonas broegbernensis TaxID=83619 RepID=A0A7V8GK95_9GAMM|nr:hypothetical protein B1992_14390 [Pseudoxanthomonas broegbernensis]
MRRWREAWDEAEFDGLAWIAGALVVMAVLVVMGVAIPYWWFVGGRISGNATDWAQFGDYFGGVAGPLLAVFSVVGLVLALLLQGRQIRQAEERSIAEQHLRSLQALSREMELLEARLLTVPATGEGNPALPVPQSMADVLDGLAPLHPAHRPMFRRLATLYAQVLGEYAATVAMYRENVLPYWDVRTFERRGRGWLARLQPHAGSLEGMGVVALAVIEHHLRGE